MLFVVGGVGLVLPEAVPLQVDGRQGCKSKLDGLVVRSPALLFVPLASWSSYPSTHQPETRAARYQLVDAHTYRPYSRETCAGFPLFV